MRNYILVLSVFFILPAFAYADAPPSLTTYTVSDSVICPAAATACASISTTIDVAFSEKVKTSIKIVGADGASLTFYSSSGVTNPNPKSWDGTNAGTIVPDGIYTIAISATSIATGLELTDTSKTITVTSLGAVSSAPDASSTPPAASTGGGGSTLYTPPPSALKVVVSANRAPLLEVPVQFSAQVTSKSGANDPGAQIVWSFGDGSSGGGNIAEKTYHYLGTYLVEATVSDGATIARGELSVTVVPAAVRIANISHEGVTIANDADDALDISGWHILSDTGRFCLPEGTKIIGQSSVLFPFSIMNFPISFSATLAYPNGVAASTYTPIPAVVSMIATTTMQPVAAATSSQLVSQVEKSITTAKPPSYADTAVLAPAASTELAAAGAPLPPASATPVAAAAKPASGILHSPWALGFGGLLVLSAGALILL